MRAPPPERPPAALRLKGPEAFAPVADAAALLDSDGGVLELHPAGRHEYAWGPCFGAEGRPIALYGRWEMDHGLRLTSLRDAWLAGGGAVIGADGGVVLDGLAAHAHEIAADPARFALTLRLYGLLRAEDGALSALPGPVRTVEEPVFHLMCQADNAFTHFLIDTLPKLALWEALPAPRPRLLVSQEAWRRWRGFLLAVSGQAEDAFLVHAPRTLLRLRQVLVASFPRWLDARSVAPFRRATAAMPAGQRRILVVRRDAWAWDRMLLNEREVVALLRRRGFEPVVPSTLDVAGQLALYRSASLVAGALGGGLLNAIFSAPGTGVLSLVSPDYTRPLIDSSTHLTGLRIAHAVGESFSASRDRNNSPYLVDLAAVERALDALEDSAGRPAQPTGGPFP